VHRKLENNNISNDGRWNKCIYILSRMYEYYLKIKYFKKNNNRSDYEPKSYTNNMKSKLFDYIHIGFIFYV